MIKKTRNTKSTLSLSIKLSPSQHIEAQWHRHARMTHLSFLNPITSHLCTHPSHCVKAGWQLVCVNTLQQVHAAWNLQNTLEPEILHTKNNPNHRIFGTATEPRVSHCVSWRVSTRQRSSRPLCLSRKLSVGLLPPGFSIGLTSQEKNPIYVYVRLTALLNTTSSWKSSATNWERPYILSNTTQSALDLQCKFENHWKPGLSITYQFGVHYLET